MWPRFGIKLGNSTVCVANSKEDGKIEVIANKQGNRVSHAVLYAPNDHEIEVGLTAKQKLSSNGSKIVVNNFQLFAKGMSEEQVQNAMKYLTCSYNRDLDKYELKSSAQTVQAAGDGTTTDDSTSTLRNLSPYQVCVEFFKASFELAKECHLVEKNPSVVLSIPNYYATESWMNLATAAEEAGFRVAQIIPEHTAALLAYPELIEQNDRNKRVLCIKSGGLLTSLSLFDIADGFVSLIDSAGPYYIGGKQFTDVLDDFISKEFYRKYKLDPQESRRSIAKIHTAAENCKHILTTLPSTQIYIDSLMDGIDFNVQMSRARYEMLMQGPLNELMTVINEAIEKFQSGIEDDETISIDAIVIAGGTIKIPKVQSAIQTRFPGAILCNQLPQDEIVAIGCAAQAVLIEPNEQELESDVKCSYTTSDIYISRENNDENQKLILTKGTLLPIETIVEMERSKADNDEKIAKFLIKAGTVQGQIELRNLKIIDDISKIKIIVDEIDGRPKFTLSDATL